MEKSLLCHYDGSTKTFDDFVLKSNEKSLNACQHEIDTKFAPKKKKSLQLVDSYLRLGYNSKASRVNDCGSFLEYHKYDGVDKAVLAHANFCKDRLCPLCAWRRSLKLFGQLSKVMDNLCGSYRFLFVTLTVKNCGGQDLASVVRSLNRAFCVLLKGKRMRFVKGYFKALEITHDCYPYISKKMWYGNKQQHIKARGRYYSKLGLHIGDANPNFDTYHPHLHCVFAVDDDYFTNPYLSQDELCLLWQKALGIDYKPVCDIRTVKPQFEKNGDGMGYKSAVCEVAKYSVKDTDFLTGNNDFVDSTVFTLSHALHHVRLCSFGGIFEQVRKILGMFDDDCIDGDLLHISDDDVIRSDLSYIVIRYMWNIGYSRSIFRVDDVDGGTDE